MQDLAASHSISQTVHVIEEYEKDTLFGKLLAPFRKNGHEGRIMVFVLYKKVLVPTPMLPRMLPPMLPCMLPPMLTPRYPHATPPHA